MGAILLKSFEALWQVLVVGIILGAGLPALFALGIRALSAGRTVAADGVSYTTPPRTAGRVGSTVLFGVCVAAVVFGIVVIIFGAQIFGK
jgi:hypothetical protein